MKKFNLTQLYLTKDILHKLYEEFGYSALGYYYEIINQLLIQENFLYEINKLNRLSRIMKIRRKKLEGFIDYCTQIRNKQGIKLLNKNRKYFWSDFILIETQRNERIKKPARRSGRRKIPISDSIRLDNAEYVNLTSNQYEKLVHKYGYIFMNNAINILNTWLGQNTQKSRRYLNKNNYAHFRYDSWVMTETKRLLQCFEFQKIYTPDGAIEIHKVL